MVGNSMDVANWIRNRIGTESGYECSVCSLSFDSDRPNCPACGCSELHEV